jgi:hypothetical protein
MKTVEEILKVRRATTKEALEAYDSLDLATMEFMLGRWKGFEIETDHQMDGLLVPSGWYGKLFVDSEEVHPLLFYANNKTELYSVNPRLIPMQMKFPKLDSLGTLMRLAKPFLQTRKSTARLRMIEYRKRVSACMCYDEKAILDHFAKIDGNRVMGVMDLKGSEPYIFILERDDDSNFKQNF